MISHRHKCIFVHVPKAAGQSIEHMFLSEHGLTWETRAPLLLGHNQDPALGPPRLAHLTAADYTRCGHIPAEDFAAYFKFAVVRNPWDRAVSLYNYMKPGTDFSTFVHRGLGGKLMRRARWFLRPQVEFLQDGKGALLVDAVLRFETLAEEIEPLRQRLGIGAALPHENKSAAPPVPAIYTPAARRKVSEIYRADVEAFGYECDL